MKQPIEGKHTGDVQLPYDQNLPAVQDVAAVLNRKEIDSYFLLNSRAELEEDRQTPDSIVPASSPESVLGQETSRFPLLTEVKEESMDRALSPVIPIIPGACIPG